MGSRLGASRHALQRIDRHAQCLRIALLQTGAQLRNLWQAQMPPHLPAPQTCCLCQQAFVHAGAVHVIAQGRCLTVFGLPFGFCRQPLEFVHRLPGDQLFHFPAA